MFPLAYLHAILNFCHQWTAGYEGEELALHGEGHGDDERDEQRHLEDQEGKHLFGKVLATILYCVCPMRVRGELTGAKIKLGIFTAVC